MDKVNLAEKFALFHEHWRQKIVGELNDNYIKLAKLEGDFIWHSHELEDELFFVVEGRLVMDYRGRRIEVGPGELIVVPRRVEHKPSAPEETLIMLIESKATDNTGGVADEKAHQPEWL